MARTFDIVVYGATGFTGRQLIKHLCIHAPASTKLAVAGRNRDKLAAVVAAMPRQDIGIVVADSSDRERVHTMCADTRVVANTAGPFALYGSAVVEGCAIAGTHYVDITGETPWVRDMIDAFHARAKQSGAKIVPFCGYDSCPSDLGTLLVSRYLRERGEDTRRVVALQSLHGGGLNGGTVASALALAESGRLSDLANRFLLSPGSTPSAQVKAESRDPHAVEWHAPSERFLTPFFMGPVNSRVVRRSDFLFAQKGEGYGPAFVYVEHMATRSRAIAYTMLAANLAGTLAGQQKWLLKLAKPFVPKPGAGPSDKEMDSGSFKTVLFGEGANGTQVRAEISGAGDAGNRVTITFLGESALAMAAGETVCQDGGILTPSYALGESLLRRVRARGMTAKVDAVV